MNLHPVIFAFAAAIVLALVLRMIMNNMYRTASRSTPSSVDLATTAFQQRASGSTAMDAFVELSSGDAPYGEIAKNLIAAGYSAAEVITACLEEDGQYGDAILALRDGGISDNDIVACLAGMPDDLDDLLDNFLESGLELRDTICLLHAVIIARDANKS